MLPLCPFSLKLFSSDDIIPYSKNFLLEHDALYLILSEKQVIVIIIIVFITFFNF